MTQKDLDQAKVAKKARRAMNEQWEKYLLAEETLDEAIVDFDLDGCDLHDDGTERCYRF